jgi:hypothetical protein
LLCLFICANPMPLLTVCGLDAWIYNIVVVNGQPWHSVSNNQLILKISHIKTWVPINNSFTKVSKEKNWLWANQSGPLPLKKIWDASHLIQFININHNKYPTYCKNLGQKCLWTKSKLEIQLKLWGGAIISTCWPSRICTPDILQ